MTHYQVLELPETATAADIRRAYRRLVLLAHPDRTPDPAAHARYLAVNAAYEVLSDPARRAAYDWQFRAPLPNPPPDVTPGNGPIHFRRTATKPSEQAVPSYQSIYLRYAGLGQLACRVLLVFGCLLGIDRMWVVDFPHEPVVRADFFSPRKMSAYCVVETPHAAMRGQCFRLGEVLAVKRTALFRQVLSCHIVAPGNKKDLIEYEAHENVYTGAGLLFPITMVLTAAVGAWPGRAGRRQVDCAQTASILATIMFWLLLRS